MDLKNQLKNSYVYRYWSRFRKWQQLKKYKELVHTNLLLKTPEELYDYSNVKAQLKKKSSQKRKMSGKCRVAGFGTKNWERFGLWDAFLKKSEFSLFDYGEFETAHNLKPGKKLQSEIEKGFLEFVDKLDGSSGVDICFFYADTTYISPNLLREIAKRGIWTIVMGLDDKHRYYKRSKFGIEIGQQTIINDCDLMWTTWKSCAQMIINAGGVAWYAPEAADPDYYYPMTVEKDLDIVFIGQSYGKRGELVKYLRNRGLHVHTWGIGWPNGFISQEEMVKVFNRAKIVLGNGGVLSMDNIMHLKGRDFEVPMCGTVYLTSYNSELADFFNIGNEILCYGSFEECVEICHYVLQRSDLIQKIGMNARNRSLIDHCWEKRIDDLLTLFPGQVQ